MSVDVSIFIAFDRSIEELSRHLQATLDMQVRQDDICKLVNQEKGLWCYIERASFQIGGTNRVYDYRIACDLPPQQEAQITGREKAQRGQQVFNTLKAKRNHALVLVYNMAKVLDEYVPVAVSQQTGD